MEIYLNSLLTLILIGIYLFNTKSQNQKIKAQSDIINDLKEHVKFFDLNKIKEYVELREIQKDKLLDATKLAFEKEFENKNRSSSSPATEPVSFKSPEAKQKFAEMMAELYLFISKDLLLKSPEQLEKTLNTTFPKNKAVIKEALVLVKDIIAKAQNVSTFEEALEKFSNSES